MHTQESSDKKQPNYVLANINYNSGIRKKRQASGRKAGRPKGSLNQITQESRQIFAELLRHNANNIQRWLNEGSKKDPLKAAQLAINLAEFFLPRQQRTEVVATGDPLVSINITDATEAAATYASVLGNTQFDLTLISFAPPAQAPIPQESVVAVHPAPPTKAPDNVVALFERLGE